MTLALILVVVLFLTIVLAVFSFGVAAYAPSSVIGSRLRSLAGAQKGRPEKTAFKERLEQALDPFSKALPLSATEVSRARAWLIQAGYRDPRHLTMYVGSRVLLGVLGMLAVSYTHLEIARAFIGLAGRLTENDVDVKRTTWSLFKTV